MKESRFSEEQIIAVRAPHRRSRRSWTDWPDWLNERFRPHASNAAVVRQELAEKGIVTSLRTVEWAVAPLRRELVAAARATVRFETRPGEQLQIDFGERRVEIGGAAVKGKRRLIDGIDAANGLI